MVAGTNIAGGLKSSSASSLLSTSTSEANIAKTCDPEITKSSDHIYEEIQSNEKKESTSSQKRPLPPIPGHKGKVGSTNKFSERNSSRINWKNSTAVCFFDKMLIGEI